MSSAKQRVESKIKKVSSSLTAKYYPVNGFDSLGVYLKKGWYWYSNEKVMPTVRGEWFAGNAKDAMEVLDSYFKDYYLSYN